MLEAFGPDIWISDGPTVTAAVGFRYPTRMAVIRLSSDDLVLWSPVALTADLRGAIEALGTIRYLVAPNNLHDSFLGDWQRAYPDAGVFAPPGLSETRRDITFAGELRDTGLGNAEVPDWTGEIDVVVVRGNRITTEAALFHRASRTAIFADLLQQFPLGWFKGWRAIVARLDLMVAAEPSVPRKFRIAFTDRQAAREGFSRILAWPAEKVLFAHGTPITMDGQAYLRRAFRWLLPS